MPGELSIDKLSIDELSIDEVSAREALHRALNEVDRLGQTNRLGRFWRKPSAYFEAIGHRLFGYRFRKTPRAARAELFWGETMSVLLPSSTDIYLTGGKSHPSEIQLARYMLATLRPGDTFVDVGAHYGYFTLLAAHLVGPSGRVLAFEAAPRTYAVLARNAARHPQIDARHLALGDSAGTFDFYEFENAYAEYNSFVVDQHRGAEWFAAHPPRITPVPTERLDTLLAAESRPPRVIKIDVEGAETAVLAGASGLLTEGPLPVVVLEVWPPAEGGAVHAPAIAQLRAWGLASHAIDARGDLVPIDDIGAWLTREGLDSGNVAFVPAPLARH